MIPFNLDKTFCASPDCDNQCGRKLIIPMEMVKLLDGKDTSWKQRISYGYFCGNPLEDKP